MLRINNNRGSVTLSLLLAVAVLGGFWVLSPKLGINQLKTPVEELNEGDIEAGTRVSQTARQQMKATTTPFSAVTTRTWAKDLYLPGSNVTTTGTMAAGIFSLDGDRITDFTGTNLSVTNGILNAACGGAGGGSNWLFGIDQTYITPSTSVGIIVNASSTIAADLIIDGSATTTATSTAQGFKGLNLISCDTIDTDINGELVCGSDDTGVGGTGSNWLFGIDQTFITPSTSKGIIVNSSSTIAADFKVDGSATTTSSLYVGGEIESAGDMNASTNGSSQAIPRIFGYKDLTSGEAARFQFGDKHNALQNAYASDVNLYSYWGLVLTGGRQNYNSGFNAIPFSKTLDTGVLVKSDVPGTGNDPGSSGNPITTFGIQATTTQWANLTEWMDSSGSTLSLVDYEGNFVLGDTATSTEYKLRVVGDTYLDGSATTTATSTAQGFKGLNLISCDTIDTDATGHFVCGSDDTGVGGTGSNWLFGIDQTFITPSTSVGIIVNASSTIAANFTVDNNATTTGIHTVSESLHITGSSTLPIIEIHPNTHSGIANRMIDIVPQSALVNAAHLTGYRFSGDNLDPADADSRVRGMAINLSGMDMTNVPESVNAIRLIMPAGLTGQARNAVDAIYIQDGDIDHNYSVPNTALSHFTAYDFVIDSHLLAANSEIHTIDVSTSDGIPAGDVAGLAVHTYVDPIHQHIGTYTSPSQTEYAGEKHTNGTVWADGIDGSEILIKNSDEVYIGSAAKFSEIEVIMTTGATKHIGLTFWFNTAADAWTQFYPLDGTEGFQQSGLIHWDEDNIPTWTNDGDPGGAESSAGYWIKIIRTSVPDPGTPTPTTMKTGTFTFYSWNHLGNLDILNATTTGWLNVGVTVPTNEMGVGDLFVGSSATTTNTMYVGNALYVATTTPSTGYELAVTGDGIFSGDLEVDGTIFGDITGDLTGNADTATALAANGGNCAAGSYPLGVDANGAAESCTDATTEIDTAIATHAGDDDAHQALVTLAGQDYLTLSTQEITAGEIEPDDLASSDFGDFTCDGTNCSFDADTVATSEILLSDDYAWTGLHTWTDARPASLNATTTNVDTLGIYTYASTTGYMVVGTGKNALIPTAGDLFISKNATTTNHFSADSTLYVKDSKVGIGTDSPSGMLEIEGTNPLLTFDGDPTGESRIIGLDPNGFVIYNADDSAYELVIDNTHNVGIGTAAPHAQLEVAGTPSIMFNTASDTYLHNLGVTNASGLRTGTNSNFNMDIAFTGKINYNTRDITGNRDLSFTTGGGTVDVMYLHGGSDAADEGDVEIVNELLISDYIKHSGDTDTYLKYSANQMSFYAGNTWALDLTAATALFNPAIADVDFSIGSTETANSFFLEGNTGNVGIGAGSPDYRLHITDGANDLFTVEDGGSTGNVTTTGNFVAGIDGQTGTTTVQFGDVNVSACLKIRDVGNDAWSYCIIDAATWSCDTTGAVCDN